MSEHVRCRKCRTTLICHDEKDCITTCHGSNEDVNSDCLLDKSIVYIKDEKMPAWLETLVQNVSPLASVVLFHTNILIYCLFIQVFMDKRENHLPFLWCQTWDLWLSFGTKVSVSKSCPPPGTTDKQQSGPDEVMLKFFLSNCVNCILICWNCNNKNITNWTKTEKIV